MSFIDLEKHFLSLFSIWILFKLTLTMTIFGGFFSVYFFFVWIHSMILSFSLSLPLPFLWWLFCCCPFDVYPCIVFRWSLYDSIYCKKFIFQLSQTLSLPFFFYLFFFLLFSLSSFSFPTLEGIIEMAFLFYHWHIHCVSKHLK